VLGDSFDVVAGTPPEIVKWTAGPFAPFLTSEVPAGVWRSTIVILDGLRKGKSIAELAIIDSGSSNFVNLDPSTGPSPRSGHNSAVAAKSFLVRAGRDDKYGALSDLFMRGGRSKYRGCRPVLGTFGR
jgi:hypothetical protein